MSDHRKPLSADPSTAEMVAALSTPVEPELLRGPDVSRRRFLQGAGAAATVSLLPGWLAEHAAAATPLGPNDGVVVLLTMGGGNDGLNTFVPINDGAYYDARGGLAIGAGDALPLTADRGLHPNLPFVKSLWDQGQVAVIEGVGHSGHSLSHFVTMAQVMAANQQGRPGSSGWLGRVIDGLPKDPLAGLSLGTSVPLVAQGLQHRATAVPMRATSLSRVDRSNPIYGEQYRAVAGFANGSTGLGPYADKIMGGLADTLNLSDQLRPLLEDDRDEAAVISKLRFAARLINANLGIRFLSIIFGDFDSHANQATMHNTRMEEINTGLQDFFSILHGDFADRTLVVGTSEFGRRVNSNGSGTDHGTSNSWFAIGPGVNGGFHGQAPSLTSLDRHRNQIPTVDYRNVYSNIVTKWLGADSAEVMGQDWGDLGILTNPGSGAAAPRTTPINVATRRYRRAEVARLYLAYFLRHPEEGGHEYWSAARDNGLTLKQISAEFVASGEFRDRYGALSNQQFVELIYQNVLGRAPDAGGLAHWTSVLDGGVSRGEVMIGFSESSEFKDRTKGDLTSIEQNGPVGRLYMAYFGRRPDDGGLDYWINTGLPTGSISDQFAASAEFRDRYGALSDRDFVYLVYQNVLGRDPDPGGLSHWTTVLRTGTKRGSVMQQFSDSPEFVARVKTL
ncbi:MAG: DUF4214 domain-containing protein [Actinomycetota bacterium]